MRVAVLLALLALALVAPGAGAVHRGEKDFNFGDHYNVQGRVVNAAGDPLSGVQIKAELLGITYIGDTDCGGDFNLHIPTYRTVSDNDRITLTAPGVSESLRPNPTLRRTDIVLTVAGSIVGACRDDSVVEAWPYRYTVEGRVVNRTAEYLDEGAKIISKPVVGEIIRMEMHATWKNQTGVEKNGVYRAQTRNGLVDTDAIGNFQFSFTVADEVDGGFQISKQNVTKILVTYTHDNRTVEIPLDFRSRYTALELIRGDAPGGGGTPVSPLLALAALPAAAALLLRGRRA